jgi:SAM-dependent methyltransferase
MDHIHDNDIFSKNNIQWNVDTSNNYKNFVGGLFPTSNTSNGYHGILQQWWEYYNKGNDILLISETQIVKNEFKEKYPQWNIFTADKFSDDTDIKVDICSMNNPFVNKYDLIINQATIEHVHDPFRAMYNLINSLKIGGILVTHTHPPGYWYHQYPKDYFRFMKDWWYDIPSYINDVELLELYMTNNKHVFTCYKKLN